VGAGIRVNGIKAVSDRVFPFEAAHDAYRFQKGGAFGKVVVTI
jgi:NADPH:quinone reductase-like Zn-dependent oxidoreductase